MASQQNRRQPAAAAASAAGAAASRDERRFAALQAAFRRGRGSEDPQVSEMKANRRVKMRKEGAFASSATAGSGALTFATGRPRDPLFR
jgi:hypothetical protein